MLYFLLVMIQNPILISKYNLILSILPLFTFITISFVHYQIVILTLKYLMGIINCLHNSTKNLLVCI